MAVPVNMTTLDLTGKFKMNKLLSDSQDEMLNHQGVGWLKRKAISSASIVVSIQHSRNASGLETLNLIQTVAGLEPKPEEKVLDWVEQKKDIQLFGSECVTKAKRVMLDEVSDGYLKDEWSADTVEQGVILVHFSLVGTRGWSTEQTWGIGEVDGERRHVRRISFTGPKGEKVRNRVVYDYCEHLL
ncbi:hypothetical protein BDP27DRAFT_1227494 [Rhodocollybia butyracea]|uniref:Uncharacterized protein n=1 Tax=Rhodocollybia butyracea TaxID=206335 RepID=A0A9P5U595_9AGAR|nr:hypothetical protein BDP27DRAFT_1227494 [Rhodocollybia butyracea]